MKKTILISITLTFSLGNFSFGQTSESENSNPYFDIVNMDNTGKVTPIKLLVNKKVKCK